jgi:hypothetical protein
MYQVETTMVPGKACPTPATNASRVVKRTTGGSSGSTSTPSSGVSLRGGRLQEEGRVVLPELVVGVDRCDRAHDDGRDAGGVAERRGEHELVPHVDFEA